MDLPQALLSLRQLLDSLLDMSEVLLVSLVHFLFFFALFFANGVFDSLSVVVDFLLVHFFQC